MRINSVPIIAIIAILALEITALIKGIDGYLLGIAIAAIAGLGGFRLGKAFYQPYRTGAPGQTMPKTPPNDDPHAPL